MSRVIALLLALALTDAALANSGPPPIPCEREVKLERPAEGYSFFTLRTAEKAAVLEPLTLSSDRWTPLPIRLKGKGESAVELYCIETAEVKRHAAGGDLLKAIRENQVLYSSLSFGTTTRSTHYWFGLDENPSCRARERITVDKAGNMKADSAVVEPAPPPRRISRLMLPGVFAALAIVAGGLWVARRR